MKQFFTETPATFAGLKEEASGMCVRFCNQPMPPGTYPNHADVGFEVNSESGAATLFVAYGIYYPGKEESVRQWFENGQIEFPSFGELTDWIQGTLRNTYFASESNSDDPRLSLANNLTDMAAIESNIPDENEPLYLDEGTFFEGLKAYVLGQDGALKALVAAFIRHLARKKPSRPAVLFAVGPTGVGKTRSAEMLIRTLKQQNRSRKDYQFLRLDMSEYQEEHRISQLLGAPQGYVGHGEGSQLIDALRASPNAIVLFDEIEKAHHAILLALMNAMDAGRLSTPSGGANDREVDCKNAVFIFTSNLDAQAILDELKSRDANGNRAIEDEVCRRRLREAGLAPEIVGRIGRFLVFQPLDSKTRAGIVALSIKEVAEEYGVKVSYIEPEVIIEIMNQNHSSEFGARPEKYLIDDMLGSAFVKAARTGFDLQMRVCANPLCCMPNIPNAGEEVENENC